MTFEIGFVLLLLCLAITNFALEWMAIEVFSILVVVSLIISGVLTAEQAYGGFANSAIFMIAGVMILTGGIIHNGAADLIARRIQRFAGASEGRMAAFLLTAVNGISAIINNIAATAMFIPVAEAMARRYKVNRGKYLMAIAFASMTGGMCTLIGTSTNVAVSGAMEQYRIEPLHFFELTPVGLVIAVIGTVYLLWVAPHLMPTRGGGDDAEAYGMRSFLYEVVVRRDAPFAGETLARADLGRLLNLNVLAIVRGEQRIVPPQASEVILPGDLLLVEGAADTIPEVRRTRGLEVKSMASPQGSLPDIDRIKTVAATVSYNSPFIGKTLEELNFRQRFGLSVMAIHRREEVVVEKIGRIRLRSGDVLLIYGHEEMFAKLDREATMLLREDLVLPHYNPGKAILVTTVLAAAILAATLDWLDTPTAFLAGGALVLALKGIPIREAGTYLNIRFLIMIAGMASLGIAMEKSGAAQFLASGLLSLLPENQPLFLMAAFFLLTVVLTQPMSNAAAALLVLPIAIHAARDAKFDERSFAIAVSIAASCSFITPFEPACLLVYSTGRYRFMDFVKVGSLLTALAFLACMAIIPILWPLVPAKP